MGVHLCLERLKPVLQGASLGLLFLFGLTLEIANVENHFHDEEDEHVVHGHAGNVDVGADEETVDDIVKANDEKHQGEGDDEVDGYLLIYTVAVVLCDKDDVENEGKADGEKVQPEVAHILGNAGVGKDGMCGDEVVEDREPGIIEQNCDEPSCPCFYLGLFCLYVGCIHPSFKAAPSKL